MFGKKKLSMLILGMSTMFVIGCTSSEEEGNNGNPDVIKGSGEKFKHRVVAEDFTGTWCVYCPRVSYAIDELEKQSNDKFVAVGLHRGVVSPDTHQSHDPWNIPSAEKLEKKLKLTGYPSAYVNRSVKWKYPENNNITYPLDFYKTESPIGIKIQSELQSDKGTVNASIKFGEDVTGDVSYVVYVQEDGLVYKQANATTLYGNTSGQGRWEMNFVHNNVVKATTDIMGTVIDKTKVKNGELNLEALNFDYKSENVSNLEVTVLVLNADGKVLNARTVKANTSTDYEKI